MCYDLAHTVAQGDTWEANLFSTSQLGHAYYAGQPDSEGRYLEAIWLYSKLLQAGNEEDRTGIQHAAWSLFAPSAPAEWGAPWAAEAAAARAGGFTGIDFSTYRIVNSVPDTPVKQGFVIGGFASTPVPEPGAAVLAGLGLLLAGGVWLRLRRA
jgi:hypothetical protein